MATFWHEGVAPDHEPYKVLLKRGDFIDDAREGRDVPYKLYYPYIENTEEVGKLPVIVWSHGFGGNRDGASFISRFLASHGYLVLHPSHRGTDSSLWEGKPGHPWDILTKTVVNRETTLNRFKDIPFLINAFEAWLEDEPDLKAIADMSALGVSGHSFGAMTTQVIAGQMFPDENNALIQLTDDRFKAGISYSPVPIAHLSDKAPSLLYGGIKMPMMFMTGTEDDSPIEGYKYGCRVVVYTHAGSDEKYLLIKKDGDHMVYNGTRGKLKDNAKSRLA